MIEQRIILKHQNESSIVIYQRPLGGLNLRSHRFDFPTGPYLGGQALVHRLKHVANSRFSGLTSSGRIPWRHQKKYSSNERAIGDAGPQLF